MQEIKERLIVALDVDTLQEVEELVELLGPHVGMFKVGLQLYTSLGPKVLQTIHAKGGKIFVDLKLHDIPNTVAQASRVLTAYGVRMFNVHASGGLKMMAAAARAVEEAAREKGIAKPLLIAVTVLTSLGEEDLQEIGLKGSPEETVLKWAKLAQEAGLDGVVASPRESSLIRAACGPGFLTVTPGVRPQGAEQGDQKRVATPREAIRQGSSYLVIGRPITAAADPVRAAQAILAEMEEGLC
ncbi:orotidine-5'-phosphate decarboxylase [Zhaonella formicivorans]|uniref:orotidine-5'-phosphate decarboxylase n=1 Tax=Zhaonella formicivorans TaxID=2528593 RepID=UPI001D12AA9C|nr:orotidine-5'-phosphate decarboxylase [Zhaonella formicivorans]